MRVVVLASSLLLISAAVQPRALAFVLSSDQASYVIDLDHGCSVSGAWAQGVYTRVHRDRAIVMAMRAWMGLPTNVSNAEIGLPASCQ